MCVLFCRYWFQQEEWLGSDEGGDAQKSEYVRRIVDIRV